MSLFNADQYEQTCSKCGHPQTAHVGARSLCHAQVGSMECKCGGFAKHDIKTVFHDRRDEQ